jgi:hypothetical protein
MNRCAAGTSIKRVYEMMLSNEQSLYQLQTDLVIEDNASNAVPIPEELVASDFS